jgi:hypothetical protein
MRGNSGGGVGKLSLRRGAHGQRRRKTKPQSAEGVPKNAWDKIKSFTAAAKGEKGGDTTNGEIPCALGG